MAEKQIQDFGEKIGGARKDVWAGRGLVAADLVSMNDAERLRYVKKDNIWPRPDWVKMHEEDGIDQGILYWQNEMRKAIPPVPKIYYTEKGNVDAERAAQDRYVNFVSDYRAGVMAVKTPEDIMKFKDNFLIPHGYIKHATSYTYDTTPAAAHCVDTKLLRLASMSQFAYNKMTSEAKDKCFAIPKERQGYETIKNRLRYLKNDEQNVNVSLDQYGRTKVVASYNSVLSVGKMYLYDDSHMPEDFPVGKYIVYDRTYNGILARDIENETEAKAFIELVAKQYQEKVSSIDAAAKESGKDTGNRKKSFQLEKLSHLNRSGEDYLHGKHANADNYLNDLGLRGGEFGNWVGDKERQASLDLGYDSFCDLANILGIDKKDVSLGGDLAIAFGARGVGGIGAGAAHYESMNNVINLTKMHGQGCLAHEWGHAFDRYLGSLVNTPTEKMFLSQNSRLYCDKDNFDKIPKAFGELVQMLKHKEVVPSAETIAQQQEQRASRSLKNLQNWMNSVKPTSRMNEEQTAKWDTLAQEVISHANELSGAEYIGFGGVYSPVETLSKYRKEITGHGISKDNKRNIVQWARFYKNDIAKSDEAYNKPVSVETDFYKGSQYFDGKFSQMGVGYWSSDVEMFARAFDCYVSDKLKAAGLQNDYLTSHANAYVTTDRDGVVQAAIPLGEERKAIFEKFDELMEQTRELGIFKEPELEPELAEVRDEEYDRDKAIMSAIDAASWSDFSRETERLSFF